MTRTTVRENFIAALDMLGLTAGQAADRLGASSDTIDNVRAREIWSVGVPNSSSRASLKSLPKPGAMARTSTCGRATLLSLRVAQAETPRMVAPILAATRRKRARRPAQRPF